MNIAEQVKKAQAGDREALLQLILAEKDELYKLCYIYLRNRADCEDILQDLMLTLIDNIHKLRNPAAFYLWVRKIIINCCYRKLNHSRKFNNLAIDIHPLQNLDQDKQLFGTRNADLDQIEGHLDLLKALDQLPKRQKNVIVLHYFADLKLEDVGQILACPSGTVKSRLHKALSQLRKYLRGENK